MEYLVFNYCKLNLTYKYNYYNYNKYLLKKIFQTNYNIIIMKQINIKFIIFYKLNKYYMAEL